MNNLNIKELKDREVAAELYKECDTNLNHVNSILKSMRGELEERLNEGSSAFIDKNSVKAMNDLLEDVLYILTVHGEDG